jgi:hypothetical protein
MTIAEPPKRYPHTAESSGPILGTPQKQAQLLAHGLNISFFVEIGDFYMLRRRFRLSLTSCSRGFRDRPQLNDQKVAALPLTCCPVAEPLGGCSQITNSNLYVFAKDAGHWYLRQDATWLDVDTTPPVQGVVAPVAITLSPAAATIADNAPAGSLIATTNVTMSDGSQFAGTLTTSDTNLFAVSGSISLLRERSNRLTVCTRP